MTVAPSDRRRFAALLASAVVLSACALIGEVVSVRYAEGPAHLLLTLAAMDGTALADGDLSQVASGTRVTSRLVFHFRDGSLHDETTVFSQDQRFRLLSDRVIQQGPAFPRPVDMSIDGATGQVTLRYADERGRPQVSSEHLDLPADVANGIVPVLLMNVRPDAPPKTLSLVAATIRPRLVKLVITSARADSLETGGATRAATHYVLHVDIGGLSGLIAPLVGKQPPDVHMWISSGEAPAFLKSEQPLYVGGPLWRIELASSSTPRQPGR